MEHPGFLLLSKLKERGISLQSAASSMRIDVTRLSQITRGIRALTADTAVHLGMWRPEMGDAEFWMAQQANYELWLAKRRFEERHTATATPDLSVQ